METLEQRQSTTTDDRSSQKPIISVPEEIIEEILSRLPVESILRFRSVSKSWLSLIYTPSFTNLHFTRATVNHRTALFISAHDPSTRKRHLLSAVHDGGSGSVTHLTTIHNTSPRCDMTESEHLNGLILFNYGNGFQNYAFVINPSTHKVFKLPDPTNYTAANADICYFFGFDESNNDHKVLNITTILSVNPTIEVMVFNFSNHSWRKLDVEFPINVNRFRWSYGIKRSACVNSVIHVMLVNQQEILAFNLRTEKFSIIKIHPDVVPRNNRIMCNRPHLVKINGLLGVVCHDYMPATNQVHIWILQDYENRVWVRETINFPKSWTMLGCPIPLDSANMEEVIFSLDKLSSNVIGVLTYNMKSGCFKSKFFTIDHPFLCKESVEFNQIKCYVESMVSL